MDRGACLLWSSLSVGRSLGAPLAAKVEHETRYGDGIICGDSDKLVVILIVLYSSCWSSVANERLRTSLSSLRLEKCLA